MDLLLLLLWRFVDERVFTVSQSFHHLLIGIYGIVLFSPLQTMCIYTACTHYTHITKHHVKHQKRSTCIRRAHNYYYFGLTTFSLLSISCMNRTNKILSLAHSLFMPFIRFVCNSSIQNYILPRVRFGEFSM